MIRKHYKRNMDIYEKNYLGAKIFDSVKLDQLIEKLRVKNNRFTFTFLEKAILGKRSSDMYRYITGSSYPSCKRYRLFYEYFAALPECQNEQIDQYYFCRIEREKLDLAELIFIHGYTIKSIYESLKAKGITKNIMDNILYENSNSAIIDKDRVDYYLKLIHAKTQIEYDLLMELFEITYKDQSVFWGREPIEDIVLKRLRKAFKRYIEDYNLEIKELVEVINSTLDTKEEISYKTIKLVLQEERDCTRIEPGKIKLLTRFLNPKLDEDELMLVLTPYESLRELTIYELIYLKGYKVKDIISQDKKSVDSTMFARFLFRGIEHTMTLQERLDICDEIRDVLGIKEEDKHIVYNAYFNTTKKHLNLRTNRQNAVMEYKLKHKIVSSGECSTRNRKKLKTDKREIIDSKCGRINSTIYSSDSMNSEGEDTWIGNRDGLHNDKEACNTSKDLNDNGNFGVNRDLLIDIDNIPRKPRSIRMKTGKTPDNDRLRRCRKTDKLKNRISR